MQCIRRAGQPSVQGPARYSFLVVCGVVLSSSAESQRIESVVHVRLLIGCLFRTFFFCHGCSFPVSQAAGGGHCGGEEWKERW